VLDAQGVDEHLRSLLAMHAEGHEVPPIDSASLITARPGRRALLAYDLGGGRIRLMGKHFRDTGQARRVFATMAHLRSETFHGKGRLGVPRPLGVLPELSMVVYVPVDGRPLGGLLTRTEATDAIRQTARWLARLHGSRLPLDRRLDVAHEVENAGEWADLVADRFPRHAGLAEEVICRLRDLAPGLDVRLDVPIHKDLHADHVIVRRRRLSVIDFDEMRLGDPAVDLAHFCAYLRLDALRSGGSRTDLERAFLGEYGRRTGWDDDAGLDFFFAYTCVKIARQLTERRGVGVRPKEKGRRRLVEGILTAARADPVRAPARGRGA
jgi:aminoglycoside phosphotransferase (APT) family kinase protein